jgi:hypothetical protein
MSSRLPMGVGTRYRLVFSGSCMQQRYYLIVDC